jgi:hypothetical protein
VLVPYSKYQVVALPFGLTDPVSAAVVAATAVTGPVVAAGGVAAPAAEAVARTPRGRATRRAVFFTDGTDTRVL